MKSINFIKMKKILTIAFLLFSVLAVAQTPMDIFIKYKDRPTVFQYINLDRQILETCSYVRLQSLGIDTTYFHNFKIIQDLFLFRSTLVDFESELNLDCFDEFDRRQINDEEIVAYRKAQTYQEFGEEIICISSKTEPKLKKLIYIKGIQ